MKKVIDMFAGIGGFSLGLERTGGYRTVAFCEINEHANAVLSRHWPGVPNLGDVTKAEFPAADIVVGGFPCQDVSRAGPRTGVAGARSGLYRQLVRAIRLVRPEYAILENVAALLDDGMGTVLGDVAESGFDAEWDCVPACAIGAPHERDRVWIVAHAQSDRCGQRRTGRPPDSFARIRDATRRHASDSDGSRELQSEGRIQEQRRRTAHSAEKVPPAGRWQWPDEPALLGVDDGIPDRLDRVRALGNSLLPQIPEMIGRAILEAAR